MLHYSTVEPGTLAVLKKLMLMPELTEFHLVGGTALSLYLGHRLSIDLDLFSIIDFQNDDLITRLSEEFSDFTYNAVERVGLFCFINGVKVDFVRYHAPVLQAVVVLEGIRLYSMLDIAAMKISAVLKRGVKKDFWDIAELLDQFGLTQIIDAYNQKYPNQQLLISIPQAITYFDDAEASPHPVSLKGQTWEGVKSVIRHKVSKFLN